MSRDLSISGIKQTQSEDGVATANRWRRRRSSQGAERLRDKYVILPEFRSRSNPFGAEEFFVDI